MSKKSKENFMDYIPKHNSLFEYSINKQNRVEIVIVNKGIFNRIAQILFKKPKKSNVELDEFGSFIWNCINGEATVFEIGKQVHDKFGEKAEPLYPRLTQFVTILHNNSFIVYANKLKQKSQE